ncbi:holo-[acyl-carrier-protein] synthase [Bacillus thuringiensis serovar navarrensis]|uniref:Holo-[acyl-carrier-protein] synthase n=2 Tax=Bacillus TaxID=1386 RepID=A0A243AMT5_BACTU|nr:holo-[acyl-carrier-protein] synthase [Bacillus thuringiensis serovar navarrensis]
MYTMKQGNSILSVSNVYGIGIDIQDITEIQSAIKKYDLKFLNKIFVPEEIEYCRKKSNPSQHFAARFSAKEALFKALGTGIGNGFCFTDAVILKKKTGEPYFKFYNTTEQTIKKQKLEAFVSLSHSKDYSIAQVVLISNFTK